MTGLGDCLHHIIEAQARRTPGLPALAMENAMLSYRELDRRANELAHRLVRMGAARGRPVALCLESSFDMIVGFLGILKAGAPCLAIEPASAGHAGFIAMDARAELLVTRRDLPGCWPSAATEALHLDELDWKGADRGPAVMVGAHDVAYVARIRGAAGRQGLLCVEHRNAVSYAGALAHRLRLVAGMSHLLLSRRSGGLPDTAAFAALASGGCLHLVSRERAEDAEILSAWLARVPVQVMKSPPSLLSAMHAVGRRRVMPACRLILGGEAVPCEWARRLRALAPQCDLFNHYGQGETTLGVLVHEASDDLPETDALPLGRPLAGSRVHLLDADGLPVPREEAGRLHIGGAAVVRGDLNRGQPDAERFVADPFSAAAGARLHRTGHRARCLPSGEIAFCGRVEEAAGPRALRGRGEMDSTQAREPAARVEEFTS